MENNELKIKKIVSKQLGVDIDKISLSSSFIEELGGDSLDTVEMILTVEDQFNIEILEDDAERMKTVQDVLNYINLNI